MSLLCLAPYALVMGDSIASRGVEGTPHFLQATNPSALQPVSPIAFQKTLSNQAILLTGGSPFVGRAILEMLLSQGARVLTFGANLEELDSICFGLGGDLHALIADPTNSEDICRIFSEVDARLGKLDAFVCNAAHESGEACANRVAYPAFCSQAIARMKEHGGGEIVNIRSTVSFFLDGKPSTTPLNGVRNTLIEPTGLGSSELRNPSEIAESVRVALLRPRA